MASDWHTEEGKSSLNIGKKFEARIFRLMSATDPNAQWISQDPKRFFDGFDVIFRGQRVEVKTNSGLKEGRHLDTCCVEITTKIGRPIGWSQGLSDVVVFIDRSTSRAYIYKAAPLREWIKDRWTFVCNGADCTLMPWICQEAGFHREVQL
jgi:hypothetical protein